ncbi:hypothetical protein Runsl_3915 [Runella slithyformis DSM 19594]|uniref:Uncharacterized protein n=1 Tax=Runella slithyformis (strain ATCC 29530 / DSM 19594 / LMG 11500 / NCIMB 11436 / LSU 4) TaxID=761193 RepID=A0A7U3ZN38_RUNSL|nr:hypothetical protein Runsl_3915 [Runella slithyformis DSM 19594]
MYIRNYKNLNLYISELRKESPPHPNNTNISE